MLLLSYRTFAERSWRSKRGISVTGGSIARKLSYEYRNKRKTNDFFLPSRKNHPRVRARYTCCAGTCFERYVLLRAIVSFIYTYICGSCTFFRVKLVTRGSSFIETGRRIFRIEKERPFEARFSPMEIIKRRFTSFNRTMKFDRLKQSMTSLVKMLLYIRAWKVFLKRRKTRKHTRFLAL